MIPLGQVCSKLLTVAAGVLVSVVCYAVLAQEAKAAGLMDGTTAVTAVDLISANAGAIAAALLVALSPADRRHAIFEAFTTWALASIVLMFIVAPDMPAAHNATPHSTALLHAAH